MKKIPGAKAETDLKAPGRTKKASEGSRSAGSKCGPQRAKDGPKNASFASAQQPSETSLSNSPQSEANPAPNRLIIDSATGEVKGADKSLDLTVIPERGYSNSFCKNIGQCTAKAYFRATKAPARKVFALENGSCLHALIEAYLKERKDPIPRLTAVYQEYVRQFRDKMSPEDREKVDKGEAEAKRMMEEFVYENKDILDRIRPEDVEVYFKQLVTLNTSKGQIQRYITGKMDLILWNVERTEYVVIDWKSSSKAPSSDELSLDTQFALYQLAAANLFGKPPTLLNYYLLRGVHLCSERFSSQAHPRDLGRRKPGCEINYVIDIPLKTDAEIQDIIDQYFANQIIKWEAGIIGKDGRADPRNQCVRCEYRKTCDEYKGPFALPSFCRTEDE